MMTEEKNILQEPQPDYGKAELDQLRAALKRTHFERFKVMTSLMKMDSMFRKAKITHKPIPHK